MPFVVRCGGHDYACRRQISLELLEATRAELGIGSRKPVHDVEGVMWQLSVAEDFISAALTPDDAKRFREHAGELSMERVVAFFNAIAERINLRTGRIRR